MIPSHMHVFLNIHYGEQSGTLTAIPGVSITIFDIEVTPYVYLERPL